MGRTPAPLGPNWPNEDKIIIKARQALELIWFSVLTNADRAAWMSRWLIYSPQDINAHIYTPYVPTGPGATQVAPQTAYAWSQIFGFYRFKLPAVLTPTPYTPIAPQVTDLRLTTNNFLLYYDASASGLNPVNCLVWATGTKDQPARKRQYSHGEFYAPWDSTAGFEVTSRSRGLTPMCANPSQPPTGVLDFWTCWTHRFGETLPLAITATLAICSPNNELVASLDVPTGWVED